MQILEDTVFQNLAMAKRLVVLMGMEFCGTSDLPGALADVHCALECQVWRLRKDLA